MVTLASQWTFAIALQQWSSFLPRSEQSKNACCRFSAQFPYTFIVLKIPTHVTKVNIASRWRVDRYIWLVWLCIEIILFLTVQKTWQVTDVIWSWYNSDSVVSWHRCSCYFFFWILIVHTNEELTDINGQLHNINHPPSRNKMKITIL